MSVDFTKKHSTTKSRILDYFSPWIINEFLLLNKLAIPNAIAFILCNITTTISIIFTGHISVEAKYLDGVSIAISFANVTGNAVTIGLSTALETLCSQAYGAKQYRRSGLYFQRGLLIHALLCFPLAALWLNSETGLLLLHQDPGVAGVAGQFLSIYSLSLPAIQITFLALKHFQSHNLIFPQICISFIGVLFSVAAQYLIVVYLQLGIAGSAIALTLSQYIIAAGYLLYIRFSHLYKQTWGGWSVESLFGWYQYLKYGVPGMIMLCFEWCSFESGYFSVGAFAPYPKVELGIYSVLMNFAGLAFSIPLGFMVAATVRVGNLLGDNKPDRAKQSCCLSLLLISTINSIQCLCLYLARNSLALIFTNDECILAGSMWSVVVIAVLQVADGYQGVAGGVIKGCGKQKFGALINVIAFQFISIPLAYVLAFVVKWYTAGFWIGLTVGLVLQGCGYTLVLFCINWKKCAVTAMQNAGVGGETFDNYKTEKMKIIFTDQADSEAREISDKLYNRDSSEDELEVAGLLEIPESIDSHPKREFYFMLATRSLTLALCFLILVLGIIVRKFNFTVPFYEYSTTNSSYCPYGDY